MIRRPFIFAAAAIPALAALGLALATNAPAQDKPAVAGEAVPIEGMAPVAYVGVATSSASAALREQLNLPRGVGLVVDSIEPDSPAQAAGVQPHDVLHKLGDQILINVQQFAVLVRTHKAGDRVTLSVIRKGQPVLVDLTLGERLLPPIDEPPRVGPGDGAPQTIPLPRPGVGRMSGVITHTDNDHVITITAHDDELDVSVKDKDGKTLFEGPLNTPEDRAKIPPELRTKIERIESHGRQLRDTHTSPKAPAQPPIE